MPAGPSLITTIVVSLAVAYAGGLLARLVRLPALFGYLVAGVVVGPFTPGFIADPSLIDQLAEIGVALLLFGVGLHFSLDDLLAVWRLAVPGAIVQVALSALLGFAIGRSFGFDTSEAAVLAACLSIASTVVATRGLSERAQLQSPAGRAALGWLVMQDLIVVSVLVMLPDGTAPGGVGASAGGSAALFRLGLKFAEVAAFVAAMLVVGRRAIPWLLERTARDGSHELFRLAVLVTALGIAFLTTELIGVSPALGAFFAGVVIADSDVSHQAAGESVPVQQVFTVLFFVSVGMLFDPAAILRTPSRLLAATAMVVVGNGLITLLVLIALRAAPRTAVAVAASLAQIGEFSFILSGSAAARGLLPTEGRDIVLGAALLSILLQPVALGLAAAAGTRLERFRFLRAWTSRRGPAPASDGAARFDRHVIIVGHGRVGSVIAAALRAEGVPYVVIEQNLHLAEMVRRDEVPVIYGDAAWPEVLDAALPDRARLIVIAVPEKTAARRILAAARRANPAIDVVVRTHSGEEAEWLARNDVGLAVMGERHAADEMARYALGRLSGDR